MEEVRAIIEKVRAIMERVGAIQAVMITKEVIKMTNFMRKTLLQIPIRVTKSMMVRSILKPRQKQMERDGPLA